MKKLTELELALLEIITDMLSKVDGLTRISVIHKLGDLLPIDKKEKNNE